MVFSGHVCLAIHDVRGGLVRVLANCAESAGVHHVVWDGRNQRGTAVSSGVYVATISSKAGAESLRIIRIP
jgi:flagellar hook assembly protein FlgD